LEKFKKIFEPIKIGPYTLKNRIVKAPTGSNLALLTGEPTSEQINFYEETAQGGVAMVVTELVSVDRQHRNPLPQLRLDSDIFIPGLRRLVEIVHLNCSLVSMQLYHAGPASVQDPVAPSDVPIKNGGEILKPRPMTMEEIEETIDAFVEAALRAKRARADMVELHGGRIYLLHQFVSPITNKRTDRWGGSFENRIRFPLEIIRGIREKCGHNFPVGYSFIADEFLPGGIDLEHTIAFAKRLEEEGVAYLCPRVRPTVRYSMRSPKGVTLKYTSTLKKVVSIPIFANEQIHEPEFMEEILEKGFADVICLGRPLLSDPELPKKVREGRLKDIRMCIKCCHCFECVNVNIEKLSCTQNPALGRGMEWTIQPTIFPKKVLVVGGGPAGLEAARVAALRGHNVTLMEQNAQLGGQVLIGTLPPGKQYLKSYIVDWRVRQCEKAGVDIRLKTEVTLETINEISPDVVILATGATPLIPSIPGITMPHVATAWDVLKGAHVGKKVVVVGGGLVGVETADFIAENGLAESVAIVEALPEIAIDMDVYNRAYTMQKLYEHNVQVLTNMKVEEITDKGLVAIDENRKIHNIESDSVIIALGAVPNRSLMEALKDDKVELYVIGDAVKPRKLINAIHEGYYIGKRI
jgi:2,4-dienoyl-CoA reductase-like NADH-dependent reductase (Old Yellow Enzyme family)/thioredoxin reductase